jgi:D-alanyl-D-alanine carboxypeptidase
MKRFLIIYFIFFVITNLKGQMDEKYLLGKFDPADDSNFVLVDKKYTSDARDIYLRKEVYEAFIQMHEDAKKDSIILLIVSGTRTYEYQKKLWEDKWFGYTFVNNKDLYLAVPDDLESTKEILKYTAMPGTSRHHWGTDIDINSVEIEYFQTDYGKLVYNWLQNNAEKYGFCEPYTDFDSMRPYGYEPEPWHWSYYPLAKLILEDYTKTIKFYMMIDFAGFEFFNKLEIIDKYVLGINPKCK